MYSEETARRAHRLLRAGPATGVALEPMTLSRGTGRDQQPLWHLGRVQTGPLRRDRRFLGSVLLPGH